MTAMFFAFFAFGTLNYTQMFAHTGSVSRTTLTAIAVLILVGAAGKSAQLPLYVWLPDAMAGPTPVSALIHAATMVTAGVYLLVRMNPIINAADPWVSTLIAWVGALTAFLAATIAISQRDIKKVLAYSTISQLGYMVLAVGCHAYDAAIFHMITHAFFKALLFLGAGSVIHAMNNEQDMDWYGKLRKFMPITFGHVHRGLARHRRGAALRRLLVQGRHPGLRLAQEHRAVRDRPGHRHAHRLLHDP